MSVFLSELELLSAFVEKYTRLSSDISPFSYPVYKNDAEVLEFLRFNITIPDHIDEAIKTLIESMRSFEALRGSSNYTMNPMPNRLGEKDFFIGIQSQANFIELLVHRQMEKDYGEDYWLR